MHKFLGVIRSNQLPNKRYIYWRLLLALKQHKLTFNKARQQVCKLFLSDSYSDDENIAADLLDFDELYEELHKETCLPEDYISLCLSDSRYDFYADETDVENFHKFYDSLQIASIKEILDALSHPFIAKFNLSIDANMRRVYQEFLHYVIKLDATEANHKSLNIAFNEASLKAISKSLNLEYQMVCKTVGDAIVDYLTEPASPLLKMFIKLLKINNFHQPIVDEECLYQDNMLTVDVQPGGDLLIKYRKDFEVGNGKANYLSKAAAPEQQVRVCSLDYARFFNCDVQLLLEFIRPRLVRLVNFDFDDTLVPFCWNDVAYNHESYEYLLPNEKLKQLNWLSPDFPIVLKALANLPGVKVAICTNNFSAVVRQAFTKILPNYADLFCDIQGRVSNQDPGLNKPGKIRQTIKNLESNCIRQTDSNYLCLDLDALDSNNIIAVINFGLIDDNYANCAEVSASGGWQLLAEKEQTQHVLQAIYNRFPAAMPKAGNLRRCYSEKNMPHLENQRKLLTSSLPLNLKSHNCVHK